MRIRADARFRDVSPAPAAERAAREAFAEIARAEEKAARALATIERSRSYVRHGFTSVQAWAEDAGFGPHQAGRLLSLGRTLLAAPDLAPKVRSGRVPAEAAMSVGRVLREPALELNAEQRQAWLLKAETTPPRALRAEAEKAIEEARQGRPTCALRLEVTTEARDGFRRARVLVSRGRRRLATEGETFGRLVADWLVENDPQLRAVPARRSGPTKGRRSRYIPREVRALVERRSNGSCEVCGVRRAVEKIHVRTPHARGGGREVDDLADACPECHVLVDAGVFRFAGFDERQRPQWQFDPGAVGGEGRPERVRERIPVPYG